MKQLTTFYGLFFQAFSNEDNLFYRKANSKEYENFYKACLKIVQDVIKIELTINQKRLLLLFLNDKKIFHIAQMYNVNHSTIHQNYNLIIKKISIALINNDLFVELISTAPERLKDNLYDWIEESKEKYNIKPHYCPICGHKFDCKYQIKKHINEVGDNPHIKYYKKQLRFIKKMLKKKGFSVAWIYKYDDKLLFSISWIYNLWKREFKK